MIYLRVLTSIADQNIIEYRVFLLGKPSEYALHLNLAVLSLCHSFHPPHGGLDVDKENAYEK